MPDETGLRVRWRVLSDLRLDSRDAERRIFVTTTFDGLSPFQRIFGGGGPAEALETDGRRALRR